MPGGYEEGPEQDRQGDARVQDRRAEILKREEGEEPEAGRGDRTERSARIGSADTKEERRQNGREEEKRLEEEHRQGKRAEDRRERVAREDCLT